MIVHISHVHMRLVIIIKLLKITWRGIHEIVLHGIGRTLIGTAHRSWSVPRVLPIRHVRNFNSLRLVLIQQFPFTLFYHLLLPSEEVRVV
jgi:hypothetical protein